MTDDTKYIALLGEPNTGFTCAGPFSSEAIDEGCFVAEEAYDVAGAGVWTIPLTKPSAHDANIIVQEPMVGDAGYDPNGTAIVFAGNICGDWHNEHFYGPFRDIKAAQKWCAANGVGSDCAIELKPVRGVWAP
jgi:hypothetical protein